jgi:predicted AlkP superfamily pyrophosphatase or phosphodiesterase
MGMKNLRLLLCLAAAAGAAPKHVVIIGVDGLSAEVLREAAAPNLKQLMTRGAWTLHARGVLPTVSSPNWMSILAGAGPEQHGVDSNEWERFQHAIEPICAGPEKIFPTLFSQWKAQRPAAHLAVIHDWPGFGRLVEKGSTAATRHVKGSPAAMAAAIAYWQQHKPDLLFVHLDDVDHAGHDKGWESADYRREVAIVDGLIGEMLAVLPAAQTLVVIVADHGGTGTKHGNPAMRELEVPWIVAGPGVARGRELTGPVYSLDTAPTVLALLGLRPHPCWTGRAVPVK